MNPPGARTHSPITKSHEPGRMSHPNPVGPATSAGWMPMQPGGSVDHWNDEAGSVWMQRITQRWPRHVWLNPEPEDRWNYTASIGIVRQLLGDRMFPLTIEGLDRAIQALRN